jgi:hypothetical protein
MGVAAVGVVTAVLFDGGVNMPVPAAGAVVPVVATASGAPVGAVAFMVVVIVPLFAPVVVVLPPGALVGVRNEMGTMGMVGTGAVGGCAWTTLMFDQHSATTATTTTTVVR